MLKRLCIGFNPFVGVETLKRKSQLEKYWKSLKAGKLSNHALPANKEEYEKAAPASGGVGGGGGGMGRNISLINKLNAELQKREENCGKKITQEQEYIYRTFMKFADIISNQILSPIEATCSASGEFITECRACYHQGMYAPANWYLGPQENPKDLIDSEFAGKPMEYKADKRRNTTQNDIDEKGWGSYKDTKTKKYFCFAWNLDLFELEEISLCITRKHWFYQGIGMTINPNSEFAKKKCIQSVKHNYRKLRNEGLSGYKYYGKIRQNSRSIKGKNYRFDKNKKDEKKTPRKPPQDNTKKRKRIKKK